MDDFTRLNAIVFGISPDSPESHRKFIANNGLRVTLLSDPGHQVIEGFGSWQLKKLYGQEHWGVGRSTFIVDPEGKIAHIWRNVKVPGHVEEVKQELSELSL